MVRFLVVVVVVLANIITCLLNRDGGSDRCGGVRVGSSFRGAQLRLTSVGNGLCESGSISLRTSGGHSGRHEGHRANDECRELAEMHCEIVSMKIQKRVECLGC